MSESRNGPSSRRGLMLLGGVATASFGFYASIVWPAVRMSNAQMVSNASRDELGAVSADELFGPCDITRYVDGDTVDVRCGNESARLRLLNIDTPERSAHQAYWLATQGLRDVVADRQVHLAFEQPRLPTQDRFGRVLAYLYAEGANLNLKMIERGWTRFYTKYGVGRFPRAFREAELAANANRLSR